MLREVAEPDVGLTRLDDVAGSLAGLQEPEHQLMHGSSAILQGEARQAGRDRVGRKQGIVFATT